MARTLSLLIAVIEFVTAFRSSKSEMLFSSLVRYKRIQYSFMPITTYLVLLYYAGQSIPTGVVRASTCYRYSPIPWRSYTRTILAKRSRLARATKKHTNAVFYDCLFHENGILVFGAQGICKPFVCSGGMWIDVEVLYIRHAVSNISAVYVGRSGKPHHQQCAPCANHCCFFCCCAVCFRCSCYVLLLWAPHWLFMHLPIQ